MWRGILEGRERAEKKKEYEKSNSHCRAAEKNDGKKQIIYKNNIVSVQRERVHGIYRVATAVVR